MFHKNCEDDKDYVVTKYSTCECCNRMINFDEEHTVTCVYYKPLWEENIYEK